MKDMLGKSGFDVIGDVHGHAAELTILFKRMGYQETNGVLRHPEGRRVVFLGDFIDRGPEIRRTPSNMRESVGFLMWIPPASSGSASSADPPALLASAGAP